MTAPFKQVLVFIDDMIDNGYEGSVLFSIEMMQKQLKERYKQAKMAHQKKLMIRWWNDQCLRFGFPQLMLGEVRLKKLMTEVKDEVHH